MRLEDAKMFLQLLSCDCVELQSGWLGAKCPLAPWTHESGKDSKPSFGVMPDTEVYHCWTCGSGSLIELIRKIKTYGGQPPKYNIKQALKVLLEGQDNVDVLDLQIKNYGDKKTHLVEHYWPEIWLGSFRKAYSVDVAREYLLSRGVSVQTAMDLDIVYDGTRHAVAFPIRNKNGYLIGMRGRYITPENIKYHDYKAGTHRNKFLLLGEDTVDYDRTVLVVESVFDYAACYPLYNNVVSPLSASVTEGVLQKLRQAMSIVTLFDGDKAGDLARGSVESLAKDEIQVAHLVPPEGEDPASISKDLLVSILKDAYLV